MKGKESSWKGNQPCLGWCQPEREGERKGEGHSLELPHLSLTRIGTPMLAWASLLPLLPVLL